MADYIAVTKDDEVSTIDQVVVKEVIVQTAETQGTLAPIDQDIAACDLTIAKYTAKKQALQTKRAAVLAVAATVKLKEKEAVAAPK